MVLAKLHTICGNCGHLFKEPVIEISYDNGEGCFNASLLCPNCATLHFFEVDFKDRQATVREKGQNKTGDIVFWGDPPCNSGICTDGKISMRKMKGFREISRKLLRDEIQH